MCEISSTKSKVKTGYKVLATKDDKFYSTFTGQELKSGAVPKAPDKCNRLSDTWARVIDLSSWKTGSVYNPKFDGMTASFLKKRDAINLLGELRCTGGLPYDYRLCLVQVTYKHTVYDGKYGAGQVIAGKYIETITKIAGK